MTKIDTADASTDVENMQARYERAQVILQGIWTNNLVFNDVVYPVWIGDSDCFWYERTLKSGDGETATFGKEYRLVDASAATNSIAFDHKVFADALAAAAGEKVTAFDLPIKDVEFSLEPLIVSFTAFEKRWAYDDQSNTCEEKPLILDHWLSSPDGKKVVFTREYNLWVRDLASGEERALTEDGKKFSAYSSTPMVWGKAFDAIALPQALWSPDSRKVFTVQQETRGVKKFPIVHHVPKDGSIRPQLEETPVALPGDEIVETQHLLVFDVETGERRAASDGPVNIYGLGAGFFTERKGWWSVDSTRIYYVDMERGAKKAQLVEYSLATGDNRVLFEETSETWIALSLHYDDRPMFLPLPETDEVLWYSERSGWAHLYLYDLKTGALKNTVTEGEWLVREVLSFDADSREVYVRTAGRGIYSDGSAPNADRDPYYCDLARINVDTGDIKTLAASDHDYFAASTKNLNSWLSVDMGMAMTSSSGVSPTGNFVVVTRSRADELPVSLLIDNDGREVLVLETADASALPIGWQWPEPVKLLAADGKTDIYGLVYRPSDFSPEKSYPILYHGYGSTELVFVSKGSFKHADWIGWMYLDAAALAELGIIVVQIDGRGTPYRHKAFQDESYGNYCARENLDDQVAGIKQLAERYPYMDLGRVAVSSYLGGGTAGVVGMLEHPEFFSVGLSGLFHDARLMTPVMMDQYEGISAPAYQHLEDRAEKLDGKLLMAHGLLDPSTPATGTLRLVEAFQNANKDFDLLLLPNLTHGVHPDYSIRRAWDFLVRHLLGGEPPPEFELKTSAGGYTPPVEDQQGTKL